MRLFQDTPEATLPKGVKDFLPVKAAKIEYLESTLRSVYSRWGCRPLLLPAVEFLDMLEKGMGSSLVGKAFRFDDRQSGKLLAIRPDITPQVARVVATRMKDLPLPLKFCYSGRVLRHEEQQTGKDREIYQSGVELFGLASAEADAEMIAMAIEGLQAVGAHEFTVDIGHAEFFRGALEQLPAENGLPEQVAEAIVRKDMTGLKALLEEVELDASVRYEVMALPKLYGGREVLAQARDKVTNARSQKALDNLEQVLDILDVYGVEQHVSIDLGEVRALNYHSGVIFQGYLAGLGRSVLQGGRYDHLTEGYGYPAPATGFTFDLLNLLFALEQELDTVVQVETDVLVYASTEDKRPAQRVARALRQQGLSASRDMIIRGLPATLEYARQMNYQTVLVVGNDENDLRLIDLATEDERQLTLADIQAPDFTL